MPRVLCRQAAFCVFYGLLFGLTSCVRTADACCLGCWLRIHLYKKSATSTLRLDSITRTQHAAYSESEFVKVWCMISQLCWRKPIWMQIFLISCCQTRTTHTSSSKLKHKKFVNNFFTFQCSAFFLACGGFGMIDVIQHPWRTETNRNRVEKIAQLIFHSRFFLSCLNIVVHGMATRKVIDFFCYLQCNFIIAAAAYDQKKIYHSKMWALEKSKMHKMNFSNF